MNIYKYLLFAIILLTIDLVWLNLYMLKQYEFLFNAMKYKLSFNIFAAIAAYLLLIMAFPLMIEDKNKDLTLKKAFIFGFLSYGIYGFTQAAIIKDYSMTFALIESIWGATLYYVSTKILFLLYG